MLRSMVQVLGDASSGLSIKAIDPYCCHQWQTMRPVVKCYGDLLHSPGGLESVVRGPKVGDGAGFVAGRLTDMAVGHIDPGNRIEVGRASVRSNKKDKIYHVEDAVQLMMRALSSSRGSSLRHEG